jgi:hypothetical protein
VPLGSEQLSGAIPGQMTVLYNRVYVNTATTGQGTVTLGSAFSNAFLTDVEASVANGASLTFVIEEGSDFEISRGVYTSATRTLTRATVLASKISGTAGTTKLNLAGSATVRITPVAEDLVLGPSSSTDSGFAKFDGTTGKIIKDSAATVAITDGGTGATTAAGAASALGVGTGDSPQFAAVNLSHASANTLTGSGGDALIEGNRLFRVGGTDVPVADGGTGASTADQARANLSVIAKNHLINGSMMLAQRGTSFTSATTPVNNDDTYLLDRWILLADGNDTVDVTQSTDAPTNGLNSIALDVETVDRKFGILQVIEQKNCIGLIGQSVTLSFWAKATGGGKLDNLKAAIIAWSSTADAVTSDIVSAWGVEDTNPTLVANWTYENTPANLTPTSSWAQYSVTATVDTASTTNIGVFIWSDVTDTDLADFLRITDVQLERGSVATTFERRPYSQELDLAQRYYERTETSSINTMPLAIGVAISTTVAAYFMPFRTPKRAVGTASVQGTASDWSLRHGGGTTALSSGPTAADVSMFGVQGTATVAAGLTAGSGALLRSTSTTNVWIAVDAEL